MSAGPVLAVVTPFPRTPADDVVRRPAGDLRARLRQLEERLEAEERVGLDVTELAARVAAETVRATFASLQQQEPVAPPPAVPGRKGWVAAVGEHLLSFVLVLAVLAFLFLAVGPATGAYRTATMLTGSMAPAMPRGSALIGVREPIGALRPGDVVTIHAPIPGAPLVTHRLVAVVQHDGRPALQTKGDANAAVDPWLSVPDGGEVWVVKASVPGLGGVLTAMRQPAALAGVSLGLLALVGGWSLLERRAGGAQAGRS